MPGSIPENCLDLDELVQEVKRGADVAVLTEESARSPEMRRGDSRMAAMAAETPPRAGCAAGCGADLVD
jgi:hypothetical protein